MRNVLADLYDSTNGVRSVLASLAQESSSLALRQEDLARHSLIHNAMPVVLSGFLETFMRDCSQRFMIGVSGRGKAFADLPAIIKKRHFEGGGRILSDVAKNRITWVTSSQYDISVRIAEGARNSPARPLWEAFAFTGGNPSGAVIKSFLENLGVNSPANQIDAMANGRRPWASLKSDLDLFISVRNECAHTGRVVSSPSNSVILDYCELIDDVCCRIIELLESHLSSM
ncbi:HEPN domain-containing protein [Termitidicoccus mucosus]|uniref:HEPN domain-containing protein n=1 Tax=Termitidicoccus mucosus TaxID=1184151 RepID=UPI003183C9E8